MPNKPDAPKPTFGLAALPPTSATSLTRYSSSLDTAEPRTKIEQHMVAEWRRQMLSEELTGMKTRFAERQIREIHDTASTEYHVVVENMKVNKRTFTGDEYDDYTNSFNHINAQSAARHLHEAADAGVERIIDDVSRPIYRPEEGRKGVLGLW